MGMVPTNVQRNLKGVAGVHFVVAQLSLRGFVALPTTRNLKSFDIVAFRDVARMVFIQVKSTDRSKSGWPVFTVPADGTWQDALTQSVSLGTNFYVFVELPNASRTEPGYYIVPSQDVAQMLHQDLTDWLTRRGKETPGRQLLAWGYGGVKPAAIAKYRDKWEILDD